MVRTLLKSKFPKLGDRVWWGERHGEVTNIIADDLGTPKSVVVKEAENSWWALRLDEIVRLESH